MAASTWSTTDKSASMTLSGSNLIATASAGNVSVRGKDPKRTGKYYIEYTSTTTQGATSGFGFASARAPLGTAASASSFWVAASAGANTAFNAFGTAISGLGSQSAGITTSTLLCAAIDLDNGLIWCRIGSAGNWNNNAANNPATGVGGISLSGTGLGQGIDVYPFAFLLTSGNSITANFGGSAFTGTVPSGFTSGWDDSVSAVTSAVATQAAIEQWGAGTPAVQLTQAAIEQWATVQVITPLNATATTRSFGQSNASVLFAGRTLSGTATARSYTRADRLRLHIDVGGRVKSRSSIRASLPSTLVLGGRIKTRSAARLLELHAFLEVLSGKVTAQSGAGTFAVVASTHTRQYAVSVING